MAGARPNYMKIAPIYRSMRAHGGLSPLFVHTGQHYDWEMSAAIMRDLGLPEPEVELDVGSGTHAQQTAHVMLRLEPVLAERRPGVVVVVGDVNSTVAAALAAAKLRIPVAHVEAGLRSFDRSMPEELNRVVTDVVSDVLFAPSPDAVQNLAREGIDPERVHLVGNVMIDSLEALLPLAGSSDILRRLDLEAGRFVLTTLHRPSNVDTDHDLDRVIDVLTVASGHFPVLLAAHPRTRKRLADRDLIPALAGRGIRVIEPVGYIDFLRLMSTAAGVLTDSGGIQEETTVLGVPCLTLRENTERPITISEGTNELVGLDPHLVEVAIERIVTWGGAEARRPALWDGHAGERIVQILADRFGGVSP